MSRAVAALAITLLCSGFAPAASANPFEEAEARRAKEIQRQADEQFESAVVFARVVSVAVGGVLLWIAVGIARNGFGFGTGLRRITGPKAWTIAAVVGLLGLSVAVGGALFARTLLARL